MLKVYVLSKYVLFFHKGGILPPVKRKRSPKKEDISDHGFERDSFKAEIMIGPKVLVGKLLTSPTGPLRVCGTCTLYLVTDPLCIA